MSGSIEKMPIVGKNRLETMIAGAEQMKGIGGTKKDRSGKLSVNLGQGGN